MKYIIESSKPAPAFVLVDSGQLRKPPLFIASTVVATLKNNVNEQNMTNKLTAIIFMGLFSFLFGCKSNDSNAQTNNTDTTKLEEITSRFDPEEGWNDIFLKIIEDIKTDTSHIYIAKGRYKNKTVGLQIEVSSKIGAGIIDGKPDGKAGFVANAVQLKSIGQESDEFVIALAELYKQPTNKGFTKHTISAKAFSLNEKSVNLDKRDYYKLKLFLSEDDEKLYSEIFLNINTDKQEIEINEKDEGYREPIIKVWTK